MKGCPGGPAVPGGQSHAVGSQERGPQVLGEPGQRRFPPSSFCLGGRSRAPAWGGSGGRKPAEESEGPERGRRVLDVTCSSQCSPRCVRSTACGVSLASVVHLAPPPWGSLDLSGAPMVHVRREYGICTRRREDPRITEGEAPRGRRCPQSWLGPESLHMQPTAPRPRPSEALGNSEDRSAAGCLPPCPVQMPQFLSENQKPR